MTIDSLTQSAMAPLIGKRCCRQRVTRGRILSVGFGAQVPHFKSKLVDPFCGEWELGTWSAAWRIVRAGRIVCGSSEVVDSIDELDTQLKAVELGAVLAIELISQFDIRVKLSDEVHIDFMGASQDEDEMFHIFGPANLFVEYTCTGGWKVGKSNEPWP